MRNSLPRITLRQIAIARSPLLFILIGLGATCIKSLGRIREFGTAYRPGTPTHILHRKAGQPTQIIHPGEKLKRSTAGHILPEPAPNTEVHFHAREGIPYYNVYAHADSKAQVIQKVEVENLWW